MLHERLAEGSLPDERHGSVIAQRRYKCLGGRRGAAVRDEDERRRRPRRRARRRLRVEPVRSELLDVVVSVLAARISRKAKRRQVVGADPTARRPNGWPIIEPITRSKISPIVALETTGRKKRRGARGLLRRYPVTLIEEQSGSPQRLHRADARNACVCRERLMGRSVRALPPSLSRRESPASEAFDRPRLAARPYPGVGASLALNRKTVPTTSAGGPSNGAWVRSGESASTLAARLLQFAAVVVPEVQHQDGRRVAF